MSRCKQVLAAICLLSLAHPSLAQEEDNGTDPTKMRRLVLTSYEHMDLGRDATRGTLKLAYEQPMADATSVRLTVPVVGVDAPGLKNDAALGDISLRVTHLMDVNRERGIVLQGDIYADSARRRELGYGTTVLKGTAIYAKFLQGGAIFAPALSHAQSLDGHNEFSETTLDFYYVPKLPDPAWYMTVDPAAIHNWETNATYASIAITTGREVGKIGGGLAQLYLKPNILIGVDRPADWSIEAGFRVIGF